MQRDYPIEKKGIPSRILYFCTCAAAFLTFAFYTAALTSWMTAQDPPADIKSFRDVLENDYKLYYWDKTSPESYLATVNKFFQALKALIMD